MTLIKGTHQNVQFSRVVDGDTIRVFLPGQEEDESLRILALDTEESHPGGNKPVTSWGVKAKERAIDFFADADSVTIEFPGNEDFETCIRKYRGNYGRLLVFVYLNDVDFQETMIREGYSPYFVKYGNAEFAGHHQRYKVAELEAQRQKLGVWDQFAVNGSERRNYAALGTWWQLRATIIDEYRRIKASDPSIYDSRLDYAILDEKARAGERATVFTEIRSIRRVRSNSGLIGIGSEEQPFGLFIPDIDSSSGEEIVNCLETRYISSGEDHPRRSYAYVTGELSTYRENPQIILTSSNQVTDTVPGERQDVVTPVSVLIASLLPNPAGHDAGNEQVTLRNNGPETVNLQDWALQDRANNRVTLEGNIEAGQDRVIHLAAGQMPLNNSGDEIVLIDSEGKIRNKVSYSANDVTAGQTIQFL